MTSARRVFAAVAVLLIGAVIVVPADAQDQTNDPGKQVAAAKEKDQSKATSIEEQLRDAYDEASAAEKVTLDEYKASLVKTADLDQQIADLDNAVNVVAGYLEAAKTKLVAAQSDLVAGQARLEEVKRLLVIEKARLDKKAVTAYVSGNSRQIELEILLDAKELRELESSHAYSSAIVDDQLAAVVRVRQLEDEATSLRDQLAQAESTIRNARDTIANFETELTTKKADATKLREAQVAETQRQATLLAQIRAKKQGYLDRLNALQRESDGISSLLRAAQADEKPVLDLPVVRTPLEPPVSVESPFGMRLHPIFNEYRMHTGTDLNSPTGTPIRAAAAGRVLFASTQDGYGNVVVIDHGDQIATVYAHMSAFKVSFGDVVARGQIIGLVGSTGYATGPHLHFEYRVSGAPVDPMPHTDLTEPLPGSCEALARSTDPAAQAELQSREDCAEFRSTSTTTAPVKTTTTNVAR